MENLPVVKLGIVATSRDCFPAALSEARRAAVAKAAKEAGLDLYVSNVTVENEIDAERALADVVGAGVNALVVYLGNFGPEGPETQLAEKFLAQKGRAVMFAAAAEESGSDLINGRGDAYCGMLNASYSIGLRGISVYIPEYPVGSAAEVAKMIADFETVAAVRIGLQGLKIFSFGPRPYDFLACNAPIARLYDLGVEIQENSELDLYEVFLKHEGDERIPAVAADMAEELGKYDGNAYPDILNKLAQYELTLLDWAEKNLGASKYFVFANKCWPAFQTMFHFVPCYVNSRLAARGIPVACEVDIWGAVSEYILTIATNMPATLLDINNTVPSDLYTGMKLLRDGKELKNSDLFMGFHCGNTASCLLKSGYGMKYQLIMKRNLEPDSEPDISRGTLDGELKSGPVTVFRLQSTADAQLRAYVAEGDVLDIETKSFGSRGVIAVPEMGRFYRHVLIEKRYPHHAGLGFAHVGALLFDALKLCGVTEIDYNRPAGVLYPRENPFAR